MTSKQANITAVVDALKERGFRYVQAGTDGWLMLIGALHAESATHECELWIDPTFIELPRVRLVQVPKALAPIAPHIAGDGGLCYLAKGAVVIDIFDPVGQTLACLVRAETVLGQLLRHELINDLEEEFFAYWGGFDCFLDLQDSQLGRQKAILATPNGYPIPVVTDDEARTLKKLKTLGWESKGMAIPVFRVCTKVKPRPYQVAWPPKNLRDILQWQGLLDPACRKKVQERVAQAYSEKAGGVVILIQSPLLSYALYADFSDDFAKAKAGLTSQIMSKLLDSIVMPMVVTRIDDKYMAERNMPGRQTLGGKRIALVGCGTIGGFLAEMLVKAGAGTIGGQLILVDKDILSTGNIGRHRLGFSSLLKNKAKALADELIRDAPGADIKALPVDVRQANLGRNDLLIDATGEEALSNWLTAEYSSKCTMLSVWIEGPGTAVRALLRQQSDGACFRCLSEYVKEGRYKSVDGELPLMLAGQGCEGMYVPFPATVSIQAACLGAEMVQDWLEGTPAPLLRTVVTDKHHKKATEDCNLERIDKCPACTT